MLKIPLPHGSIKEKQSEITPAEIPASSTEGLARTVISATFYAKPRRTVTPLTTDGA